MTTKSTLFSRYPHRVEFGDAFKPRQTQEQFAWLEDRGLVGCMLSEVAIVEEIDQRTMQEDYLLAYAGNSSAYAAFFRDPKHATLFKLVWGGSSND